MQPINVNSSSCKMDLSGGERLGGSFRCPRRIFYPWPSHVVPRCAKGVRKEMINRPLWSLRGRRRGFLWQCRKGNNVMTILIAIDIVTAVQLPICNAEKSFRIGLPDIMVPVETSGNSNVFQGLWAWKQILGQVGESLVILGKILLV